MAHSPAIQAKDTAEYDKKHKAPTLKQQRKKAEKEEKKAAKEEKKKKGGSDDDAKTKEPSK
jgi:hypothetical protein